MTFGTSLYLGFAALPGAFLLVLAGVPLLLWLALAGFLTLRESSVHSPNRIAQLYGYTVCLITLILALTSFSSLMDAAFDRANPLQDPGRYPFDAPLTSFEAFKARGGGRTSFDTREAAQPDTASEATLRTRYDALVADRVARVRYDSAKAFTTKGILLLLSLGLFSFHWRWVRRPNGTVPPTTL